MAVKTNQSARISPYRTHRPRPEHNKHNIRMEISPVCRVRQTFRACGILAPDVSTPATVPSTVAITLQSLLANKVENAVSVSRSWAANRNDCIRRGHAHMQFLPFVGISEWRDLEPIVRRHIPQSDVRVEKRPGRPILGQKTHPFPKFIAASVNVKIGFRRSKWRFER